MPLLLYTYLVTETLAPFFACLAIMTGILFLGRLIPIFDLIINFGIGADDFLRLCAYMLPNLFLFALPMASMLGVILCFTRMAHDNELIALKAAGIGLYRLLPAVILIALSTSLLTVYSSTILIPKGTVAMKKLLFQLAKDRLDQGLKEKRFSEGLKDVVLYIEHIDPEDGEWRGVFVSDTRDKENPLTIIARSGGLATDMEKMLINLTLRHGSMHLAKEEITQTVSFDAYTLNLPIQPPKYIDGDRATSIGKGGMTQGEIREYLATHPPDSSGSIARRIEYHKRLVMPVGCFILTILALPLALHSRPGQRSIGLPLGLMLFILYYITITVAKSASESGSLPVAAIMWAPNAFFAVVTVYLLRFANRESTINIIGFIFGFIYRINNRLPRLTGRRKR